MGFFTDLPPVAGAIDAVHELLSLGHDVRICTLPVNEYRYCVSEKYEWVERHLGVPFVHRMIVTKGKTLVHGDLLIDTKPEVTGVRTPDWEHVIFDKPYNQHVKGRRVTWLSWKQILL